MKTINNNDLTIQLNIDEEHVINYGLVKSIDFIFYTSDNKTNSIVKDLSHCDLYNYITLSWDELKLLEQGVLKYEYTINVDYQTTYKGNVTTDYYICTNITNSNEFNRITLNDFYTKEQIDSMLQDSDLSNYYTKAEVNYLIPTDYIKSIPSEYITENELTTSLTGYSQTSHTHSELTNRVSALETELNGVSQQITELNNMVV